jgi:hypothetical protein
MVKVVKEKSTVRPLLGRLSEETGGPIALAKSGDGSGEWIRVFAVAG